MESAYDPLVNVRRMRPDELESAVSVWREANIARGAAHGPERTARIREKLSASDALPFVGLRPGIVGMALAEPGRFDDGAGEPDPYSRLRPGTEGTVSTVDDLGTVHVDWDDGGRLGMVVVPPPGRRPDRIELVCPRSAL